MPCGHRGCAGEDREGLTELEAFESQVWGCWIQILNLGQLSFIFIFSPKFKINCDILVFKPVDVGVEFLYGEHLLVFFLRLLHCVVSITVKANSLYGFVVANAVDEPGGRVLPHIDSGLEAPCGQGVVPVLALCPRRGTPQRQGTH